MAPYSSLLSPTILMKNNQHFLHRPSSKLTLLHDPWPFELAPGKRRHGGRWAFNLASENLFLLGATPGTRRVYYRTPGNELRFLPLHGARP
jgi:hypothetical protein